MKKLQFIFAAAALLVLSLGMTGCDPNNPNNPDMPAIVSTSETNNNGIIVEAIYKNNIRLYFRLTGPNTCSFSYYYYFYNSPGFEQYDYSGDLVIPETLTHKGVTYTVTCIGNLGKSTKVTSISIPKTIENLSLEDSEQEYYPFIRENSLASLKAFNVATDNPYITSIDGVLFSKDKTRLLAYPKGKAGEVYSIPEGTNAFGGGYSREEYYYGGSFSAFEGHFQFSSLIVPNSVTDLNEALSDCHSLRTITLPSTMRSLGFDAPFYGCDSLTSVTCLATTPPILRSDTASVKRGAPMLKTAKVPAGSVSAYRAAAAWKDLTIVAL